MIWNFATATGCNICQRAQIILERLLPFLRAPDISPRTAPHLPLTYLYVPSALKDREMLRQARVTELYRISKRTKLTLFKSDKEGHDREANGRMYNRVNLMPGMCHEYLRGAGRESTSRSHRRG